MYGPGGKRGVPCRTPLMVAQSVKDVSATNAVSNCERGRSNTFGA